MTSEGELPDAKGDKACTAFNFDHCPLNLPRTGGFSF